MVAGLGEVFLELGPIVVVVILVDTGEATLGLLVRLTAAASAVTGYQRCVRNTISEKK